ncbi:MAG: LuxR C-terminal-related transcriptional regulator [Bacillota bacterium]
MPPVQPDLVPRPHLLERLAQGMRRKLTLISAPAGFGKSTLVAHWQAAQTEPVPVAWVALDDGDNDPVRFWTYVIAALAGLPDGPGREPLALLRATPPAPIRSVLTVLINELSRMPGPAMLVLDDFHLVTQQEVHEGLTFFLENLPPQLHLVIATRIDPPLPLSRLRARGQVSELRAADLRFSDEEVRAFLDRTMGVTVSPEQAGLLNMRTEGWVAGLQLAGLSLQGVANVGDFIQALAGSHRHIADYLMEEVLHRQDAETLSFLVQTAVLDRLTGPLCDAVTARGDSEAMLHRLERANLFLIPLDHDRRWYRYHHLFQDLLQLRLRQEGAELIAQLHQRASRWYESRALADDAIRHALVAGDSDRAAALVEGAAFQVMYERGEYATLTGWVQGLPDALVRSRPHLSTWYASALILTGHMEEGEERLDDAERTLPNLTADEASRLSDRVITLRTLAAVQKVDVRSAIALADRALRQVSPDNRSDYSMLVYLKGLTYRMTGNPALGIPALGEALRLIDVKRQPLLHIYTLNHLAILHMLAGELDQAHLRLMRGLELAGEAGTGDFSQVLLADLLRERNELDQAEALLRKAIDQCGKSGRLDPLRQACLCLARIQMARGDRNGAVAALDQALQVAHDQRMPHHIRTIPGLRAQVDLRFGDLDAAARWAVEYEQGVGVDHGYTTEPGDLNLARVQIARGQAGAALTLLQQIEQRAESAGRRGSLIEIRMLQALGREALGDGSGATASLKQALEMAQPQGYVRLFVDEGPPLAKVLTRLRSDYATRLLELMDKPAPVTGTAPNQAALVEPLTERELQVLCLLAEGCSNQEIADRLILAEGTVKKHTHNIFGKLGVASRIQAILRAAELGLLP